MLWRALKSEKEGGARALVLVHHIVQPLTPTTSSTDRSGMMKVISLIAASIGIYVATPASSFSAAVVSPRIPHGLREPSPPRRIARFPLRVAEGPSGESRPAAERAPLIDLQTFLKLCDLVQTGGEAKAVIQSGEVRLNWDVETRRAKKLFAGDEVTYGGTTLDVADQVSDKGYVYRAKKKKAKPAPRVLEDGSLEFRGRYRSEEWRADRLQKKAARKAKKNENERGF